MLIASRSVSSLGFWSVTLAQAVKYIFASYVLTFVNWIVDAPTSDEALTSAFLFLMESLNLA